VHDGQGQRLEALKLSGHVQVDQQASLDTFTAALASGQQTFKAAADRIDHEQDIEYPTIDIQAAREMGVMPITLQRVTPQAEHPRR
jgi:hypothetical protein